MFGGGPHQQDVVAAAFARAPPSTEDALAIVPQDLEAVTHWHRNPCRSSSAAGYHHATARHSIERYIRPHSSGRMRCESDLQHGISAITGAPRPRACRPDDVRSSGKTGSRLPGQTDAIDESPEGISPPGAPRTVHDPLESHGSRCSAVAVA